MIKTSIVRVVHTFRKIRQLPNAFRFLLSWMTFSDGLAAMATISTTIAATSPLFFTATQLGLLLLEVNLCALAGSFLYDRAARYVIRWYTKQQLSKGVDANEIDTFWVCFLFFFFSFFFHSLSFSHPNR